MIVKILRKSETYKGVSYNTNKMEQDKGELMKVSGFDALMALDHLKPSDYINYLEAISARSSRIRYPQFHAMISCKGRSHTKEELVTIADAWMNGMGYGGQPYLLVFHKDTANNHIHLVSTRIDRSGKKISDSFEKRKAYQVLNQVLAQDDGLKAKQDIEKALAYSFSTRPQFMMLLEAQGYTITLSGEVYMVYKFDKKMGSVPLALVDATIKAYQKDKARISQLHAVFDKYRNKADPRVYTLTSRLPGGREAGVIGYSSKFAEAIREKFGIQLLFHGKEGKTPYGYTIIDHTRKVVMKGKEVMDIKELIAPIVKADLDFPVDQHEVIPPPELVGEEKHQSDVSVVSDSDSSVQYLNYSEQLPYSPVFSELDHSSPDSSEFEEYEQLSPLADLRLDIAEDIDDEQILGRNRRRKRKARTNTR